VYSCQALEKFKSFLRIKIDVAGVTIYPIGLRDIANDWKPAPGATIKSETTFPDLSKTVVVDVPEQATRIYDPDVPLAPQLIEGPIHVR
jgi:hypothetical protein